jgi:hypothetical protein
MEEPARQWPTFTPTTKLTVDLLKFFRSAMA